MQCGWQSCLDDPPVDLARCAFGMLVNQASVDDDWQPTWRRFQQRFGSPHALFAPQHGLWAEQQANMIESPHHSAAEIPVYSLYSETRRPTAAMLDGLGVLLVDLQDVGCRVYTFAWTLLECLQACGERGVEVVVLDRPNPLGRTCEGPLLDHSCRSFVGGAEIPLRHGLTLSELARWMVESRQLEVTLHTVPIRDWNPRDGFAAGAGRWIPPSPNLPTLDSVQVYPGQVLLEGTNVSEGRGTTRPFEQLGAPWIDGQRLAAELATHELPGVRFRPLRFEPTFDKWQGQSCGGVFLHVTDPQAFRSVLTSVVLIATIQRMWPEDFEWLQPPYEYETRRMPIDILFGSDRLRNLLQEGAGEPPDWLNDLPAGVPEWISSVRASCLYDPPPSS